MGVKVVEIDFVLFYDVVYMFYDGVWVVECYIVIEDFMCN